MAITSPDNLSDAVKQHRRTVLEAEQHEQSLQGARPVVEPPYPIPELDDDSCDCGGTYDEYDRCSDCTNGHDDCEVQECESCFERAIDRAESAAEGMER